MRCTPSAPSAGAEAGSSLASSSRPLAQSERAVLSRRDARSKVSTPGFRNGARRTALAPKPLILAVLSPLCPVLLRCAALYCHLLHCLW